MINFVVVGLVTKGHDHGIGMHEPEATEFFQKCILKWPHKIFFMEMRQK